MLSAPPDKHTLVHNNIQSCCSVSNYWFAQKIKYIEYFSIDNKLSFPTTKKLIYTNMFFYNLIECLALSEQF